MDLFDSLDKIIPVLVFFFWVIISIFTQSKNKKRPQKTNQGLPTPKTPYRRPVSTTPPSPYEKSEPAQEQPQTFEDLKKKLETIFSESLPVDEEPEEYKEEDEEKYQPDTTSTEKQSTNETAQKETSVVEVAAPTPLPAKIEKKKWYSAEGTDAYIQAAVSSELTPVRIDLSIEKIREGMILSEILAPPVSLRQDSF